jgi:hypothetical protein
MRREPEFAPSGYEVNRRVVAIQSDACYFDDPDPFVPKSDTISVSLQPGTNHLRRTTVMRSCELFLNRDERPRIALTIES